MTDVPTNEDGKKTQKTRRWVKLICRDSWLRGEAYTSEEVSTLSQFLLSWYSPDEKQFVFKIFSHISDSLKKRGDKSGSSFSDVGNFASSKLRRNCFGSGVFCIHATLSTVLFQFPALLQIERSIIEWNLLQTWTMRIFTWETDKLSATVVTRWRLKCSYCNENRYLLYNCTMTWTPNRMLVSFFIFLDEFSQP